MTEEQFVELAATIAGAWLEDAYPKKTCLWTGNGFTMPWTDPVQPEDGHSRQHLKLGGKSAKTKNIRSATPRGFARAVYEFNSMETA